MTGSLIVETNESYLAVEMQALLLRQAAPYRRPSFFPSRCKVLEFVGFMK